MKVLRGFRRAGSEASKDVGRPTGMWPGHGLPRDNSFVFNSYPRATVGARGYRFGRLK